MITSSYSNICLCLLPDLFDSIVHFSCSVSNVRNKHLLENMYLSLDVAYSY